MSAADETYHILFYDFVADYLERREAHRDLHLALVHAEHEAGRIVLAGALGTPPTRGALIFRGVEPSHIERFVGSDPYVALGLVAKWQVVPYHNVL